jgi:uncharacterized DUF497 family protein
VSAEIVYDFEWDAAKARTNLRKHGVSFRAATAVFRDPLARTIFDDEHSEREERWVTLGQTENGQYLVVVHTVAQVSEAEVHIRIISARAADRQEIQDYEQTPR